MKRRHLLVNAAALPWLGLLHGPARAQATAFDPALASSHPEQAAKDWLSTDQIDGLRELRRVSIAQFRVMFATQGLGSASASGGFGSGVGSAHMHGRYVLTGVDAALMQAITDSAYQRFSQSLQARGVGVVPFGDLPAPARERIASQAVASPAKLERSLGKGTSKEYQLFSAAGLPLYFGVSDPLRQHMGFAVALSGIGWDSLEFVESGVAASEQIGLLKVTLVMDFIELETSGGFFSRTASVGGEPGIQLTQESALRAMVPKGLEERPKPGGGTVWTTPSFTFDKMPVIALKHTLQPSSSGLIGMTDATDAGLAAFQGAMQVIGMLGGLGGGRKDKRFEVKVDPAQYHTAANATLGAVLDTWATQIGAPR